MKTVFLILASLWNGACFAQQEIKVYPANWWTGMKNPRLQIMLRGKNISKENFSCQYPGILLLGTIRVKNPDYLFLNLKISSTAKPGMMHFTSSVKTNKTAFDVELKTQSPGKGKTWARGVQSSDFIYLIMPDRFSNGDTTNDKLSTLLDTTSDRANPLSRHGGDLQGVTQHLDYLQQLGVTTLWLTPVIENNMPLEKESAGWMSGYHGYWFTDHYAIDPRMGGRDAYLRLTDAAHAKGLKIIQDAVYNHIGIAHWFMTDPPDDDWINHWPAYQNTSHREQAIFDIHAARSDKEVMEAGWFVPHLPDLNLKNPLLATYLIQQALWMTETFRLDGWRVDTYKYCDEKFLNQLNAALYEEFPSITSLAESTVTDVASGAYFCRNNMNLPFKSNATGILDFPVGSAMIEASKKNYGWNDGVNKLYTTLAEDMLYKEPMNNCIFLDNHDMDRFYSVVGENYENFIIGIGLLLTQRGIPHLYYGTEILMKNFKKPSDAMVRDDFPGGFPGDPQNKFLSSGRSKEENAVFDYVSKLANYRKTCSAITNGSLMQYIPANKLYVYFRYDKNQTVLCAVNSDTVSARLSYSDYSERTTGFNTASNVLTGNDSPMSEAYSLPARSITILELKNRTTANKVVH